MKRVFRHCRVLTILVVGTAVLVGGVAVSSAQSPALADVARKEAARRKDQPTGSKVYTNKDLPESAQNRAAPPAPGTAAALPADPAVQGQKPEAEAKAEADAKAAGETKDEAWWKERVAQAREEVRRNQMFAEALQSRINALSRDFVNRDNPVQRSGISKERGDALNELARVNQDLERGKKQIADLEEEARKAGVPPGWLR